MAALVSLIGGRPEQVDGPFVTPAHEGMAPVDVEPGFPEDWVG